MKARFAGNLSANGNDDRIFLLRIALDIKQSSGAERPHEFLCGR